MKDPFTPDDRCRIIMKLSVSWAESIAWEESEIFMGERCSEHIKSNQKRTVNRLLFNTILIPQCCWPPRTTLRNEDESTQATWSCKMNQNVKLLIWTIGTSTEKRRSPSISGERSKLNRKESYELPEIYTFRFREVQITPATTDVHVDLSADQRSVH